MMALTIVRQSKMSHLMINSDSNAQVVKLVDTRDLKSLEGDFVPVQVRPWVPKDKILMNFNILNLLK